MQLESVKKLDIVNKSAVEALRAPSEKSIVKNFIEASLKVMGGDFGFAWYKNNHDKTFRWMYKTENTPYEPATPRPNGVMMQTLKSKSARFIKDVVGSGFVRSDAREYMESVAIIPMAHKNKVYGNLVICFKKTHVFTEEEKSLAVFIGNVAAQAITINRLYSDLKSFRATLDNTSDSIFIFDPETLKIEYLNQGAILFSGQKPSTLLKKPLTNAITGLSEAELRKKMEQIVELSDPHPAMMESTITHPVLGKVPVEISLQHISHKNQPDQFLAIVRDISERKQSELSITKMAYYDQLTGVPNRALLMDRLKSEHIRAQTEKGMYGIFFIDLDRFKIINDIYGHQVGDVLLKQVAQRISRVLPKKATVARMGGDEFLVLLPKLKSVTEAEQCAVEIQSIFNDFFKINEHELYSNGSVGFAIFPLDGMDYHVVMKHADLALNRAKEHGGGDIQHYHVGQPLFYTMQPKLQNQLRQAIKRGELLLQYQPVVHVKTKKIIGSEALIRWNHPEMGLLYPGDFVGQAEESGLIIDIGRWVINEVCRQIREWEDSGRIPPPVSINVSPRELLRPTLVDTIEQALKKYKISPSQIKLELTESFLMKNIDLSISILQQLKNLGLRILIDDFGTGYASLNYLRRLPIDAVKIDRSFVSGVPVNLQDAALTSAIIAISHQLGLEVVAEGVEKLSQFEFLRAAQCNFAQGNFFYKPASADQFSDLLRLTYPN